MDDDDLDENLDAASLISRWRQAAAQGRRFKAKWTGEPLPPQLMVGDVLEMIGPTAFELRPGDLICYQRGADIAVRHIVKHAHADGRNAFVVKGGSIQEAILQTHILGKVIVIQRGGHRVVLDKKRERKRLADLQAPPENRMLESLQHRVDSFHFWWDRLKARF